MLRTMKWPKVDITGHILDQHDPSDLIVLSDGTDADNNGYIDDISGWILWARQRRVSHIWYARVWRSWRWCGKEVAAEGGNGAVLVYVQTVLALQFLWEHIHNRWESSCSHRLCSKPNAVSGTMAFGKGSVTQMQQLMLLPRLRIRNGSGWSSRRWKLLSPQFSPLYRAIFSLFTLSPTPIIPGDAAKSYMNTWNYNNGARMSFSALWSLSKGRPNNRCCWSNLFSGKR